MEKRTFCLYWESNHDRPARRSSLYRLSYLSMYILPLLSSIFISPLHVIDCWRMASPTNNTHKPSNVNYIPSSCITLHMHTCIHTYQNIVSTPRIDTIYWTKEFSLVRRLLHNLRSCNMLTLSNSLLWLPEFEQLQLLRGLLYIKHIEGSPLFYWGRSWMICRPYIKRSNLSNERVYNCES